MRRAKELIRQFGVKWIEELLDRNMASTAEEIKDILDKVIALDARVGQVCPCRVKNLPSMWNSTIPYDWEDFTKP